ncbi:putative lipid II flippase FtsW [Thiohalocapsa marina]|uniref:Probable peptidoglycan glycosyltransferase FtsW n=1 Tax=Thiohalocapsa marina TaxID=424902 RepID=A0A5M8FSG0_9GAMM|nr:putative lipid II flippase FtsW [Thiohalocapsa marina]KAA6186625.1 putative lipid II flippase FtsW [Thiohalocapsa marina]
MTSILATRPAARAVPRGHQSPHQPRLDGLGAGLDLGLLICVAFLLGLGFVMVTSASMPIADRNYGDPFFYVLRHGFALGLALICGALCFAVPLHAWQRAAPWLLALGIALLVLLLLPGVGRTVNGATRWVPLGVFSLQPSELLKFFATLYVSDYMVRRRLEVQTSFSGFLRPMVSIGIACALIMAQPDFGTAAVILMTVMGLLFLGGVNLRYLGLLVPAVAGLLVMLILVEPYRLTRVTSFLRPFDDPYNTGYQLSQALIAFGRGEWLGVGLGNGIQKQFYLPEAHTDFLLAVIGEEFGLLGVLLIIALFAFIVWRAFDIGARAHARGALFSCYLAHGFGLLLGMQVFINVGVNTGLLPTKGLPLPFMSYGSNALIVAVMMAAVLLRIDFELRRRKGEPIPNGRVQPVLRSRRWSRA